MWHDFQWNRIQQSFCSWRVISLSCEGTKWHGISFLLRHNCSSTLLFMDSCSPFSKLWSHHKISLPLSVETDFPTYYSSVQCENWGRLALASLVLRILLCITVNRSAYTHPWIYSHLLKCLFPLHLLSPLKASFKANFWTWFKYKSTINGF